MTLSRSSWMSRPVLATAAFVGMLMVLVVGLGSYWAENAALQQQFETKSRLLTALERQSRRSIDAVKEVGGIDSRSEAITATSGTLAASEAQTNMVGLIEDTGGILHSIQAQLTTDVSGDGLRRLKTQVTFDASNEALQKVLFKVETGKPFSFIDSLIVQPTQSAGSAQTTWQTLRVTLEASSYWRGDGRPSEDPVPPAIR